MEVQTPYADLSGNHMAKPQIESAVLDFIILCSHPTRIWELGEEKNSYPTIVGYRSEHVKLVSVDVFIHVVQPTILEAVYSDILTRFAGNEEALFSIRIAYCYSQSSQLHDT